MKMNLSGWTTRILPPLAIALGGYWILTGSRGPEKAGGDLPLLSLVTEKAVAKTKGQELTGLKGQTAGKTAAPSPSSLQSGRPNEREASAPVAPAMAGEAGEAEPVTDREISSASAGSDTSSSVGASASAGERSPLSPSGSSSEIPETLTRLFGSDAAVMWDRLKEMTPEEIAKQSASLAIDQRQAGRKNFDLVEWKSPNCHTPAGAVAGAQGAHGSAPRPVPPEIAALADQAKGKDGDHLTGAARGLSVTRAPRVLAYLVRILSPGRTTLIHQSLVDANEAEKNGECTTYAHDLATLLPAGYPVGDFAGEICVTSMLADKTLGKETWIALDAPPGLKAGPSARN